MEYRTERDSMGEVKVPADRLWGAQTQRSLQNFQIGQEKMPREIISALALIKAACARVNFSMGLLSEEQKNLIVRVCNSIIAGNFEGEFPLSVWQTGSGTQTNMNLNEVIANSANRMVGKTLLHPNDHVNRSQSSNDVFPTALHLAFARAIGEKLAPALGEMIQTLARLEAENADVITVGRTHLQDAVPLSFGQEIGGWRAMVERSLAAIEKALEGLYDLALGGTAVGTGLNAPAGFGEAVAADLAAETGLPFRSAPNKFHALSARDDVAFAHGALKTLAADLYKIATDIRWLSSGPRCGFGEIAIPENEPGSSIMPGKVNPTQCEALCMVAVQVMGNDTAVGIAASQGNFQLNVYLPLLAYNCLQSVNLLADAVCSFNKNCLCGLRPIREKMEENLRRSLMLVTALSPKIGYDNAAKIALAAHKNGTTLREEALNSGLLSAAEFDALTDPKRMI